MKSTKLIQATKDVDAAPADVRLVVAMIAEMFKMLRVPPRVALEALQLIVRFTGAVIDELDNPSIDARLSEDDSKIH